ncbi:hypothetical protein Purlil1_4722 [Purpureocillium lilacinum]|uniref:Uncharacterized protein n=1 Tax=Purpureocillium lilacinum TaxID=33203 RepID=A0ABR0C486_PURLI|nr:hypothetical protein Purlil1_4722 [Purpureocillium lilacinum]
MEPEVPAPAVFSSDKALAALPLLPVSPSKRPRSWRLGPPWAWVPKQAFAGLEARNPASWKWSQPHFDSQRTRTSPAASRCFQFQSITARPTPLVASTYCAAPLLAADGRWGGGGGGSNNNPTERGARRQYLTLSWVPGSHLSHHGGGGGDGTAAPRSYDAPEGRGCCYGYGCARAAYLRADAGPWTMQLKIRQSRPPASVPSDAPTTTAMVGSQALGSRTHAHGLRTSGFHPCTNIDGFFPIPQSPSPPVPLSPFIARQGKLRGHDDDDDEHGVDGRDMASLCGRNRAQQFFSGTLRCEYVARCRKWWMKRREYRWQRMASSPMQGTATSASPGHGCHAQALAMAPAVLGIRVGPRAGSRASCRVPSSKLSSQYSTIQAQHQLAPSSSSFFFRIVLWPGPFPSPYGRVAPTRSKQSQAKATNHLGRAQSANLAARRARAAPHPPKLPPTRAAHRRVPPMHVPPKSNSLGGPPAPYLHPPWNLTPTRPHAPRTQTVSERDAEQKRKRAHPPPPPPLATTHSRLHPPPTTTAAHSPDPCIQSQSAPSFAFPRLSLPCVAPFSIPHQLAFPPSHRGPDPRRPPSPAFVALAIAAIRSVRSTSAAPPPPLASAAVAARPAARRCLARDFETPPNSRGHTTPLLRESNFILA